MNRRFCIFLVFLVGVCPLGSLYGQANLDIEGAGFFENRALKSRLAFLQGFDSAEAVDWDAAKIEDSAFLLLEQLQRRGHFAPSLVARLVSQGEERSVEWTVPYDVQLDVDVVADSVTFVLQPGQLGTYESVEVSGITAIEPEAVRRYFIPGGALIQTRRTKVFTPDNLDRRANRVITALQAMGYREARLESSETRIDETSGAVTVELAFSQGPRFFIERMEVRMLRDGQSTVQEIVPPEATPWTREWTLAKQSELRNEAYRAGYPDVQVRVSPARTASVAASESRVELAAEVDWGEPVTLVGLRFEGDPDTREETLTRRSMLEVGQPLDRLAAEATRRRLMSLGIFQTVGLKLAPEDGAEREVTYQLEPSVRRELDLLAGWGSYEQARLGLRWQHRNPFGRAHRYEVEAKQSLKASLARLGYFMPQAFGSNVLAYSDIKYNFREEISYERTSLGASVGASYTTEAGVRLGLEYGISQEDTDRDDPVSFGSEESATVASLSFRASYDRRDDFLSPESGWRIYGEYTLANEMLGGSVNFHKAEAGLSYHVAATDSAVLHVGLRGGAVLTSGSSARNIPFNERFFQGGEGSLRGYQEGEASPLDADGDLVGAEAFGLLNLEFEQRLSAKFSAVIFHDALISARDGFEGDHDYLSAVGLGFRYQTVVGPVRIEYGHNLNPRERDPEGTLHFSLGFPF